MSTRTANRKGKAAGKRATDCANARSDARAASEPHGCCCVPATVTVLRAHLTARDVEGSTEVGRFWALLALDLRITGVLLPDQTLLLRAAVCGRWHTVPNAVTPNSANSNCHSDVNIAHNYTLRQQSPG